MAGQTIERADAMRQLAREEAQMVARQRGAYMAEADFGRRHSMGRDHDAEADAWCRRVDALGMNDAENAMFMGERVVDRYGHADPNCTHCRDSGMVLDNGADRDCPECSR